MVDNYFKKKRVCFPKRRLLYFLFITLVLGGLLASLSCVFFNCKSAIYGIFIDNFDECVNAKFPVVASDPPRCYLDENKVFIRDPQHIRIFEPKQNQYVESPLIIKGEARALNNQVGFELKEEDGLILASGIIPANSPEHGRWGDYQDSINFITDAAKGLLEVFDITPEGDRINIVSVLLNFKNLKDNKLNEDDNNFQDEVITEENEQNKDDQVIKDNVNDDNGKVTEETKDPLLLLTEKNLPEKVSLDVPFTPQAPFADWNPPFDEACEEASLIMVHYYLNGERLTLEKANTQIILMTTWLEENGYEVDVSIDELKEIVKNYYQNRTAYVYKNSQITIENIKKLINAGYPVIIPAAGQLLENPYFRGAGPPYHMLVITGFDNKHFYTNDPGTRNGENFQYTYENLMNSIHDWTGSKENIEKGEKAMMIIK